jgi:hypothetical protein
MLCFGKRTALLQAEASVCVQGLANVLFCEQVVHYLVFYFNVFSGKFSVCFGLILAPNNHLQVVVASR